jgi:hypothetical protein
MWLIHEEGRAHGLIPPAHVRELTPAGVGWTIIRAGAGLFGNADDTVVAVRCFKCA